MATRLLRAMEESPQINRVVVACGEISMLHEGVLSSFGFMLRREALARDVESYYRILRSYDQWLGELSDKDFFAVIKRLGKKPSWKKSCHTSSS